MNAFLFTAGYTITQAIPTPDRGGQVVNELRTWDNCTSAVIYGGNGEQALKRFEEWLTPPDEEPPARIEIKRVVAAPFVDPLLTELGPQPLDWPRVSQQLLNMLQITAVDDFEQGYWVNLSQILPSGKVSSDLESLRRALPDDIRSGLNWTADKQFFFLISVLSPLPTPAMVEEPDAQAFSGMEVSASPGTNLDRAVLALEEMRYKEAAALVHARNSVVAGWLWRKHAANTPLASNAIHVTPCCNLIPFE